MIALICEKIRPLFENTVLSQPEYILSPIYRPSHPMRKFQLGHPYSSIKKIRPLFGEVRQSSQGDNKKDDKDGTFNNI
jgi:hypothetical protein